VVSGIGADALPTEQKKEGKMAWVDKLKRVNEPTVRPDVPWTGAVARVLPGGITSISTVAVLDLLDMPVTTGNARRLAAAMRTLGFVPIKSRRLAPGGFRDTNTRGWARPVREPRFPPETRQTAPMAPTGA
jgi:hypothetical protein